MGRPSDIPQDVWDAAGKALGSPLLTRATLTRATLHRRVAHVILAERERCAKIADGYAFDAHELAQATNHGWGAHTAATSIAKDIREGR